MKEHGNSNWKGALLGHPIIKVYVRFDVPLVPNILISLIPMQALGIL